MWILLCANSQKNSKAKNWEAQKKQKETHLIFSGKGELRCFLHFYFSCLHLTLFQVCSGGGRLNLVAFTATQCRTFWWYQKVCILIRYVQCPLNLSSVKINMTFSSSVGWIAARLFPLVVLWMFCPAGITPDDFLKDEQTRHTAARAVFCPRKHRYLHLGNGWLMEGLKLS